MRTNDKLKRDENWKDNQTRKLMEDRTPVIEECMKIQLTTKENKGREVIFKTEIGWSPCNRIEGDFCGACPFPEKKWRGGICNLATHLYLEPPKQGSPQKFITPLTMTFKEFEKKKAMINPIKKSKRGDQ